MTEAHTTNLFPNEWQALCHGSAQQLANYLGNMALVGEAEVKLIDDHLARLRTFIGGWVHSSAPFLAEREKAAPQSHLVAQTNGASAQPAKRRGRPPKAKPDAQVVQ